MELILGIDDAGRGPVVGPMIVAGVLLTPKTEKDLKEQGVKDSKDLTSKRREFLADKVREKAETYETIAIFPDEIDGKLNNGTNLNVLEAMKMAELINKINKGYKKVKVIIDCPSVSIEKWKDILKTYVENLSNLEIVCEHKADKNHTSVSAASIIAKSLREKEMAGLKEVYGEIGSGYCSDPVTCKFLEKHCIRHEKDGLFRTSWVTWKRAFEKTKQRKLF